MTKGTQFQTDLQKQLKNPSFVAEYVLDALKADDPKYLAQAMGNVLDARNSKAFEDSDRRKKYLLKKFSCNGIQILFKLNEELKKVGLKLNVSPIKKRLA